MLKNPSPFEQKLIELFEILKFPDWPGCCNILERVGSTQLSIKQEQTPAEAKGKDTAMVAIFMLATFAIFLTVDYIIQKRKSRVPALKPKAAQSGNLVDSLADRFVVPRGYFLSPGHAWAEILPSGSVRVGIDDFLQKIAGTFDAVHVLKLNSHVAQGEPVMILKQGDRLLSVCAPLSGEVVKVNEAVLSDPASIANDPYGAGWICTMEPNNLQIDLLKTNIGAGAARWLREEVSRFRDFIRSAVMEPEYASAGITMADGGVPLGGALRQTTENSWLDFEEKFLLSSSDIAREE